MNALKQFANNKKSTLFFCFFFTSFDEKMRPGFAHLELPSYSRSQSDASTHSYLSYDSRDNADGLSVQPSVSTATTYDVDSALIFGLVADNSTVSTLPTYSLGATVEPVTRKNLQHNMLKITINSPRDTYSIGDIIRGKILFSPVKEVEIHRIFIVLECKIATFKPGWQSDYTTSRNMVFTYHTVPVDALPLDLRAQKNFLYTFPFTLQVPQMQTDGDLCKLNLDHHLNLPPSVGSLSGVTESLNNLPGDVARINYQLRATVQQIEEDTRQVSHFCNGVKYLHFIPSYHPSPSAIKVLLQKSYSSRHELKKSVWKKSTRGIAELKVLHLPVLSMNINQTVNVLLALSFCPKFSEASNPPPMVAQMTTQLVARTYYSVKEEIPIAMRESKARQVTQTFVLNKLTTATTPWELAFTEFTDNPPISTTPMYSTQFQIPVTLPQDKSITPNFETCLIARDYLLKIKMYFQDSTMVSVSVPAVIVARLPLNFLPISTL